MTNKWSTMKEAMELYKHIQREEYEPIEKTKNPFVLIQVSKMLHGRNKGRVDQREHSRVSANAEPEQVSDERKSAGQQSENAGKAVRNSGDDGATRAVPVQAQEIAANQRRVHPEANQRNGENLRGRSGQLCAQLDRANGERRCPNNARTFWASTLTGTRKSSEKWGSNAK